MRPWFLLLCASSACAGSPAGPETPRVRSADGTPIAYEERGAGARPLVLVHGWCGAAELWDETAALLAERHRVVALDLGGHGRSGRGRDAWTLAAAAEDVAALLVELELERAVLVGHSMGGPVALLAAALEPERVAGVLGVETLHQVDYPYPPELAEQLARSLARDFEASVERYVRAALPLELEEARARRVVEVARRTDRGAALALLEEYAALDARAALQLAPVPVRCVNSAQPVPTDVAAARRWSPGFEVLLLERTGHFPMVEAPAELAAALEELLARLPEAPPR